MSAGPDSPSMKFVIVYAPLHFPLYPCFVNPHVGGALQPQQLGDSPAVLANAAGLRPMKGQMLK